MILTQEDLVHILEQTGYPVTELAFPDDEVPKMPFIVYQDIGSDNFGADNMVYFPVDQWQIDLYMSDKRRDTEKVLESAFTAHDIFWEREVTFDDDEECYRSTYIITT